MSDKIFMYPNFSKGGVSAVLRGRAAHFPFDMFYGIFDVDRDGENIYDPFDNIETRVVRKDRQNAYLNYVLDTFSPTEASVLSNPSAVGFFADALNVYLRYEFHSSDMRVVKSEIDRLPLRRVDEFVVPSNYMAQRVESLGNAHIARRLTVVPNLVDTTVFGPNGPSEFFEYDERGASCGMKPLIWVGRFDKGKGYTYLLRTLAVLPEEFVAYVVVSLEDDPSRTIDFLSEAGALGVSHRVKILSNVSPAMLANMFRSARRLGGYLVSTSLLESFGYSVAEALSCELRVRAFDLPVWQEHPGFDELGESVSPGDVFSLAASLDE